MNSYKKYCPNVFVAKCTEKHEKGDTIIVETRYGKKNEHIVHNLVGYMGTKEEPFYLYSITRADGYNSQERAKAKAERIKGWARSAKKRSDAAFEKADLSEEKTGIPFGQPILVGHHSESAHRKIIERADNAMRKSIEESEKAKEYENRAKYWESMANKVDLSMPESVEFFKIQLKEAMEHHKFLKEHPDKRPHSLALTYAKKKVNDLQKKCEIAVKLWG